MKCPSCGAENRVGELLCDNCGELIADLSFLIGRGTETRPVPPSGNKGTTSIQQITFKAGRGKICRMPVWEGVTIVLGRGKISPARVPVLDLAVLGAEEKGVSRQHAVINVTKEAVLLADLGSTNGTLLNGRKLVPNAPSILEDGDVVTFGRLKTHVIFT